MGLIKLVCITPCFYTYGNDPEERGELMIQERRELLDLHP